MNYLFVGMAECSKRMESKKRKERKARKNLRWRRRRRNMYRRILQRLLDAFVLLQLDGRSSLQKRRKKERQTADKEREREGVRRERQRKRLGKFFSLPRFVAREPASTFAYYAEF